MTDNIVEPTLAFDSAVVDDVRRGADVTFPDLSTTPRFLLIEVNGEDEEGMEVTITTAGLTQDDVKYLVQEAFFNLVR